MTHTVLPLTLGWSNPGTGPTNLRLYALDKGESPRWDRTHAPKVIGRVAEHALEEARHHEGDRFLLVYLGNRAFPTGEAAAVAHSFRDVLTGTPPTHDLPASPHARTSSAWCLACAAAGITPATFDTLFPDIP